jgi:hypothetical protein
MFPRVTHPSATSARRHPFDLHVLGLPPAFILSQDQTLKLKSTEMLILDVEPSHICLHPRQENTGLNNSCAQDCRNNQEPTNREAFPGSSGGHSRTSPTWPDMQTVKRRSRPNRPHIPSSQFNFQRAKTQNNRPADNLGAMCCPASRSSRGVHTPLTATSKPRSRTSPLR